MLLLLSFLHSILFKTNVHGSVCVVLIEILFLIFFLSVEKRSRDFLRVIYALERDMHRGTPDPEPDRKSFNSFSGIASGERERNR